MISLPPSLSPDRTHRSMYSTLEMRERVSVLTAFSRKAFHVIITRLDWTLLWSFILVSEYVSFSVLENLAALRVGTSTFFSRVIASKVVLRVI
jgi:hypothetical protein